MRLFLLSLLTVATTLAVVHELTPEGQADAKEASTRSTEVVVHTQEVQSVSLDGRHLPMLSLRETLSTRVGDKLDATHLDRDRATLEEALVARGYLSAHVDPAVVAFGSGGGAFVTFPVHQGQMFHLRSVTVTGATARDAGVVTISKGDEAVADRIERARLGVAERLSVHARRTVTVRQQVDLTEGAVDVELIAR